MATIYHRKKGEYDKWSKMKFNHIVEIVISLSNIASSKTRWKITLSRTRRWLKLRRWPFCKNYPWRITYGLKTFPTWPNRTPNPPHSILLSPNTTEVPLSLLFLADSLSGTHKGLGVWDATSKNMLQVVFDEAIVLKSIGRITLSKVLISNLDFWQSDGFQIFWSSLWFLKKRFAMKWVTPDKIEQLQFTWSIQRTIAASGLLPILYQTVPFWSVSVIFLKTVSIERVVSIVLAG